MPEVGLRRTVAIGRGGVEEGDPELQRAGDRPLLIGCGAAHHQAADRAAPEAEHRQVDTGSAERLLLHLHSLPVLLLPLALPLLPSSSGGWTAWNIRSSSTS